MARLDGYVCVPQRILVSSPPHGTLWASCLGSAVKGQPAKPPAWSAWVPEALAASLNLNPLPPPAPAHPEHLFSPPRVLSEWSV